MAGCLNCCDVEATVLLTLDGTGTNGLGGSFLTISIELSESEVVSSASSSSDEDKDKSITAA